MSDQGPRFQVDPYRTSRSARNAAVNRHTGQTVPLDQQSRRFPLSRRVAFWVSATVFCLLFVAAAAPSPLYRVYQAQWGFSTITLTAAFAVYALVLLVTLLIFGSASDYFGRRRTIAVGLLAFSAACGVFLVARGVGALFVARALQGVAVGVATGPLGATMLEFQDEGSGLAPLVSSAGPPLGLAIGGLGASALVQYGPSRTQLVWWLLLGAGLVSVIAVFAMPEPRLGLSLTLPSFRPRLRVPARARGMFIVALPCLVGIWALSGFYLSLGPSLAEQLVGSYDFVWGGVVIVLLFGLGVPVMVAVRKVSSSKVMFGGCAAVTAGALITFTGIVTRQATLLLTGSAVAGLGWGPAFMGAFGAVVGLVGPADRAGLIASIYAVGYLAFSVPAVIAGVASSRYGLHDTALVYSLIVAALAAIGGGSFLIRRAPDRPQTIQATTHGDCL
jgi:MFS family permease